MQNSDDILSGQNDAPKKEAESGMQCFYTNNELAERVWQNRIAELEYDDDDIAWKELFSELVYSIVDDYEARRLKALLYEMRLRLLKPIGAIKELRRLLFSHISLLFGLCSSQSSLILNAFYGNSLSRIPSL